MISKNWRRIVAAVGVLVLLAGLLGSLANRTEAANLTAGNYTYVLNGEEVTFPFDPVVRKEGLLLPVEVFQELGIQVDGTLGANITLGLNGAPTTKLTLGTAAATVDGFPSTVSTAPLRLAGRVFLPSDILQTYGVDATQDGNYIILRNYTSRVPEPRTLTAKEWNDLKAPYSFSAQVRSDTNQYLDGQFMLLTPELLNTSNIGLSYGTRARLLGLLETNTLVLTKIETPNLTKASTLNTNALYLVDTTGNQYDLKSVQDIGKGLLSSKLVPGASRTGILLFPPLLNKGTVLSLFYDPANGSLGSFTRLQ